MDLKVEQQTKTKKGINTLKVVSAFLIIWFIFVGLSFAADSWTEKIDSLAKTAHFIVSFLSRWRALLATLAGKLMSNDLIYWSFMHLDIFLWKTRNIMKNFANYTLWFLFLYMIIKSIIEKDWANDIIKKKLTWFIVAWVLIQASWFLIWAVVDISTIAVTAIWAIPWQIIQSDLWLQTNLAYINAWWWANLTATWETRTGIVMTFDPNKKITKDEQFITTEAITLSKPITQDNYLDMILPSYNSISWPLIFFGTSIFKFQDYSFSNPETTKSWKRLVEFALNLLIILIYSLAMLALVIINFFRIFFLWIVIMFSPFIILLWVFGKMWIIKTDKIKWLDQISISNVFKLIFKPVIFMAYISIMMIFVIWVRAILIPMNWWEVKLNDEIKMNSQTIDNPSWWKSYNSSIKADWIFNFSINWAKNSIAELMVYFFTLFLLRALLKTAISKWSWMNFLDTKLASMTKSAENIAGQIPIVPIAWWVWVNSVFWKDSKSLISQAQSAISDKMGQENEQKLRESPIFGKYMTKSWTNYDLEKSATSSNPEKFWTDINTFATSSKSWISYDWSPERRSAMSTRYDTNKTKASPDRNRAGVTNITTFIDKNADKIHKKMWWSWSITDPKLVKAQTYWAKAP